GILDDRPFTRQRKRQNQPGRVFFVAPAVFFFFPDHPLLYLFFFRLDLGPTEKGVEQLTLVKKNSGEHK
ncbi:hypothetical protein ACVGW8_19585, partial [Enterobacter hormaechei]